MCLCVLERIARRRAYPLRPQRTGQGVKAEPQTAGSFRASPLLRLAIRSSNTSSPCLLRLSSCAASIHHRRIPRRLPVLRDDPPAHHSSHREPYPVDKLLKFRS
ncbi:hypothetical protein CHARACLAT_017662 [Characodon lateralis]|uniref:Uncharacterized protein n=1 Tax=Characodon lateralis TaxID=208331 RepID=A0ABU7E2T0_9TELE|nr:hypothetical protein [Characodon lateralis]